MTAPTTPEGPSILILAKSPEPGRVKTRLCPPLTPVQAADLAAAALLDTIAAARGVSGAHPVAVMTGLLERAARRAALIDALREVVVVPQRGSSLGERIAAAHRDGADGRRTLQVGMDTPQVGADMLAAADRSLMTRGIDAVLGLAPDGGWWAMGLRNPAHAELIAEVPTSRDDTGERTLAALRAGGLRVALLPEVSDVDTAADAATAAAAAPGSLFGRAVAALPPGALDHRAAVRRR